MENEAPKSIIRTDILHWLYFLITFALTIFSFIGLAIYNITFSEWQSGRIFTYAILFLSNKASWIFFPLIIYSVFSLLFISDNNSKTTNFFIRLGIYTGVVLSLQYTIILVIIFSWYVVAVWVIPFLLFYIFKWLCKKTGQKLKHVLGVSAIIIVSTLIIYGFVELGLGGLWALSLFVCAVIVWLSSPFWTFLIFSKTSIALLKYHEANPYAVIKKASVVLSWFTLYGIIMRVNILKMYEAYASLPVESSPTCYIATAAASGHSFIVGSKIVKLSNGNFVKVNSQLQRLKSVELTLMAASPRLHCWIRKIYDVVGKKMAAYIHNPLLADVAFLLLVPVEWVSFHTLKIFVPEIELISKKIYHS